MGNLTYNEIYNQHGEETGIAYENLVASFIADPTSIGPNKADFQLLFLLAATVPNLLICQDLVHRARLHATQEIEEAAKNQPIERCEACGKVTPKNFANSKTVWLCKKCEEIEAVDVGVVTPAYGRDYKDAKTAEADWLAGKDFIFHNPTNRYNGKYCSIRDFKQSDRLTLRYDMRRYVVGVRGSK